MEIQQVALDRERVLPECRAIANVGDRIEALAVHLHARDVNAVLGNELVVAAEVDGRNRVLVTVSASATRRAHDVERPAEQLAGLANVSLPEKFADTAAGDCVS